LSGYYAVLLDTVSIQQYIFSSNRLKDNLGASNLVKSIYENPLHEVLVEQFQNGMNGLSKEVIESYLKSWKEDPGIINIKEPDCPVEVGYVGGGNALIFFKEREEALQFIKSWSLKLIIDYPGIQTAVALKELSENYFDDEQGFKEGNSKLFNSLAANKARYNPTTVILKHGITADCRDSGHSAEINERLSESDSRYISVVASKKKAAAEKAETEIKFIYKDLLNEEYTFTSRLDELGQTVGDSNLAVVHIDGNSMALRFLATKDLSSFRNLSKTVQDTTEQAFENLLKEIIDDHLPVLDQPGSGYTISRDQSGKIILPLRYIVLGGDDITFVTDGRLGVFFAERFIKYFTQVWQEKVPVDDKDDKIGACAGVCIVKTKYPFFRAYEKAEELCKSAKVLARKKGAQTSWLDYHIAYGGISGDLDDIRDKHYSINYDSGDKVASLLFGPYRLCGEAKDCDNHLDNLKKGMTHFIDHWPRSKRKDLRLNLSLGPDGKAQLADYRARGLDLPEVNKTGYHKEGWIEGRTPYHDMVDLIEYYPAHVLSDKKAEDEAQKTGGGEVSG
jgi:hypothetical protein